MVHIDIDINIVRFVTVCMVTVVVVNCHLRWNRCSKNCRVIMDCSSSVDLTISHDSNKQRRSLQSHRFHSSRSTVKLLLLPQHRYDSCAAVVVKNKARSLCFASARARVPGFSPRAANELCENSSTSSNNNGEGNLKQVVTHAILSCIITSFTHMTKPIQSVGA